MPATSLRKSDEAILDLADGTDPGGVLRRLRTERKLTLAEVSKMTGLPVSTLSKVETGKMPLNYSKLLKISRGLELDITRFFAPADASPLRAPASSAAPKAIVDSDTTNGRRSLTRGGEGPTIRTATYHYRYPAADLLRKSLNPMILEVKVRSIEEFGELMRHPGEEYAMVIEGECEFHCDLYAPVTMLAGDSIYFDGVMGHAYVAVGDTPCRILCVCSATDEDLKSKLQPVDD